MSEIKNAIIESAILDIADRGLLTAWLQLNYGGSGQGFGGYSLYLPPNEFENGTDTGGNYAGIFIYNCLKIADVGDWSKLKGRTIRARIVNGWVEAIGHIVKDEWFCPSEAFGKIGGAA